MSVSIMKASIKKELWEFSGMLTWIPVALAGIFIFMPLLILLLNGVDMKVSIEGFNHLSKLQFSKEAEKVFMVFTLAIFVPFILIGFIVQLYYFVTCLYDERRDQSVMFWRSLPVSDTVTIASKVLTGAVMIPVIFYSAATALVLFGFVLAVIACLILSIGFDVSLWGALWSSSQIINTLASIWLILLPAAVWLLPLYAWLILTSIYAKKSPFLWAVLPIVALLLIEAIVGYYLQISQPFFGHFIADYFSLSADNGASMQMNSENYSLLVPIKIILANIDYRTVLVSAGLLFATYWCRVNKQEY